MIQELGECNYSKSIFCCIQILLILQQVSQNNIYLFIQLKINNSSNCFRKYQRPLQLELNVGRQLEEKDVSSTSLISEMNWSQDKNMIACSSQASSSPRHSPTPYNSWQHISAIYQPPSDPLDKIPRTFHNLKHKYSKKSPSPLDLELDSDNSLWGDKDIST